MERTVDNMKLTQKQQETVDRFHDLEKEYGKGNVFLRWINDYWKVMFVIHRKGEEKFETHLENSFKVNGKVLKALEGYGLLQCQNVNHEKVDNDNWALHNGISVVGSKIMI